MGPPAGKGKGKGFGGRGHGLPDPQFNGVGFGWRHQDFDNMPLTSLGRLRDIDTDAYKYFEWKFRLQIVEYTTNLWPIIQGGTDDEALETWKDIAHLLEFDARTWNGLMLLVHQGAAGRAEANKILWDLLTQLCLVDHAQINCMATSLIGAARKNIDRPPGGHHAMKYWTYEKAIEPRPGTLNFAAENVPLGPRVITGPGGSPLAPPRCWFDENTGLGGTPSSYVNRASVNGSPAALQADQQDLQAEVQADNRSSRRSHSTKRRTAMKELMRRGIGISVLVPSRPSSA